MSDGLHQLSTNINDVVQLLINLHIIALFVINLTHSPRQVLQSSESYTYLKRLYRVIELMAGLVTPLAKK